MRDKCAKLHFLFAFESYFLVLVLLPALSLAHSDSKCVLFNFGDSNTDPGAMAAALGLYLNPPYGQQFFNRSTGRFSDGRLYIDFICQDLKIGLLSPYLESSGSDFSHGVNFAVAGATAGFSQNNPVSLYVQAQQFGHFQNRTRELRRLGKGSLISEEEFRNAVYSVDIGGNDVINALLANSSYQQFVYRQLPIILEAFGNSIKALHKLGARKFWIYNTPPSGCVPALLATEKKNDSELDESGCLTLYNNASKALNEELSKLCDKLRSELQDGTIVYVDMYAIKNDLFANPGKYGFENPLMACCGYGGPPYNFEEENFCGGARATACADPSRSVVWDGSHFTEAANAVVASKIMSGKYSKPFYKLQSFCKKDHC